MRRKAWTESQGKKRLEKISNAIKGSRNRGEFREKIYALTKTPLFRGITLDAVCRKLQREEGIESELGKSWKGLPLSRRNALTPNWTDEMRESFKKDWPILPLSAIKEKYRKHKDGREYSSCQFSFIGKELGVSRNLRGLASTKGAAGVDGKSGEELTPEQELIRRRETKGGITPEGFIAGLAELKPVSDLKIYWDIIQKLLEEKRVIRNTDLLLFAVQLKIEGAKELLGNKKAKTKKNLRERVLNSIRGILGKFVEWGALSRFTVGRPGQETHDEYICNLPRFYTPEELKKLIPDGEKSRILNEFVAAYDSEVLVGLIPENEKTLILDLLPEDPKDPPKSLKKLADELRSAVGENLLSEVLEFYVSKGLVRETKAGFRISALGLELGVDAQSIKTLEATALENALFVKQEEAGELPGSLSEVREALERDRTKKTVAVTDLSLEVRDKDLKVLFLGEVMYGSQHTDQALLNWILDAVTDPTLIITSGLVQGRFEVRNKAKTRMLAEEGGLHKIETQFHSAGMLLEWLERVATSRVCVIQGDDDWRLAEDYGTLMHLAEGKNPWKFGVDWSSFSAEMKRRLENRELRNKIRTQWEIIQAYMYRIGRSLLNRQEVEARIGVSKSEYRLIIEIMVAKRNNFDYPKEYEQVVNVNALFGNIGKRIVSPDPLRILVAPGKEMRLIHNAGFSDITQYRETIQHLDAIARHLGLSRQELPFVLADFHQESFCAEYLMGTWVMNLPGFQNTSPAAAFTMREWHTKILEAKERRQSRVRKEPVSPSAPEITFCKDGRIRIRVLNHAIQRVLEEQKNEPERKEIGIVGTDWQFGSITMWPEFTAKFVDYGLYARGAQHLWVNGDGIHGGIYPQYGAENRPIRLTTLHSQQKFFFDLIVPLILDAPALVDLASWLGNHEWNNLSAKYQGDSPLTFLETGLQGVLMERKRVGTESPLQRAMNVSRIRWRDTHNPQGDIVNWPFYADTICGFKVAIQHMWQPFHGHNPTNDAKRWLKNMARAARGIDLLIGGHLHCVWMTQLGDKLIVQAGAGASESGYDLHYGLFSTVMYTLVEFSNRTGITVEFVPWEFLRDYKFQSPAYKGKDEFFVRPTPGTKGYKQGKMAPFIENMIDELTQYLEV